MNERIQALATQAGMVEYPTGIDIKENTLWGDRNISKFAELIVKECMTVTKDYTCNQGWDYSAPVALARHFKELFE
jgi:hypothetical protein